MCRVNKIIDLISENSHPSYRGAVFRGLGTQSHKNYFYIYLINITILPQFCNETLTVMIATARRCST
jgi:hypothetical protein